MERTLGKCAVCGYRIKSLRTFLRSMLARRDFVAFEFRKAWLCGDCHDSISEHMEGE